jgi:hypothetical protein
MWFDPQGSTFPAIRRVITPTFLAITPAFAPITPAFLGITSAFSFPAFLAPRLRCRLAARQSILFTGKCETALPRRVGSSLNLKHPFF